jgi:hypothetical protein
MRNSPVPQQEAAPGAANGALTGPAAGPSQRQPTFRPQLRQPYTIGDFSYNSGPRAGQRGTISMIKLGVWAGDDLPRDVRAHHSAQPTFPRSSTLQQLHDDQDFEAYREVGAASMRALLASGQHRPAARRDRVARVPELGVRDTFVGVPPLGWL